MLKSLALLGSGLLLLGTCLMDVPRSMDLACYALGWSLFCMLGSENNNFQKLLLTKWKQFPELFSGNKNNQSIFNVLTQKYTYLAGARRLGLVSAAPLLNFLSVKISKKHLKNCKKKVQKISKSVTLSKKFTYFLSCLVVAGW